MVFFSSQAVEVTHLLADVNTLASEVKRDVYIETYIHPFNSTRYFSDYMREGTLWWGTSETLDPNA